ncbi:TetR/AcrR family transcriptional regulator [Photobacterium ganghwense]|uniref:TetR family transcriptional regulator n=1 Tax=Photobacterium ganghwense TaxID=320778 RepID=A0A0J1HFY4_9GAMM|nr:TetR/AcrR family transcriptional regulator [Photobacterium ganghwense]KLV10556.1 TetR family transcriptional regulator [Photobacterium ganghwense]PSU09541.1 TetR/AcrR family transcriptional regulator [Photobacterium ganghwense]
MNAKTNDTRQHILEVGYELIVTKGFTSVGLSELLKSANVPKGSFYHYFKSKEHFGEWLIQDYFTHYLANLAELFHHPAQTGYECLIAYFERWIEVNNGCCNANKCLIVKLSAEVSDLSEPMRLALRSGADRIIDAIAGCIEKGITDGSIKVNDSQKAAHQIYYVWVGASLLNKLYQDQSGLKQCLENTKLLLKGQ